MKGISNSNPGWKSKLGMKRKKKNNKDEVTFVERNRLEVIVKRIEDILLKLESGFTLGLTNVVRTF